MQSSEKKNIGNYRLAEIELKKWNASGFFKTLSILPLLGSAIAIYNSLDASTTLSVSDVVQLAVLLAFGIFAFGLGKRVAIFNDKLISKITWFSLAIKTKEYLFDKHGQIEVRPKVSTHTGGIGGGSRISRYFSIEIRANSYMPTYDLASHCHFGRGDKSVTRLGDLLVSIAMASSLTIKVHNSVYTKIIDVGINLSQYPTIEEIKNA